jgi:hypothetical protein
MLIEDIIKTHEKSLIQHFKKNGESKRGHTIIHTLKQKVDYIISPKDDWNVIYLKELSNEVKDCGINVTVKV